MPFLSLSLSLSLSLPLGLPTPSLCSWRLVCSKGNYIYFRSLLFSRGFRKSVVHNVCTWLERHSYTKWIVPYSALRIIQHYGKEREPKPGFRRGSPGRTPGAGDFWPSRQLAERPKTKQLPLHLSPRSTALLFIILPFLCLSPQTSSSSWGEIGQSQMPFPRFYFNVFSTHDGKA